jgi:hypothetical protein
VRLRAVRDARASPGSLLQLGASAGQFPGSLREFAAAALVSGSAPLQPDTPEDGRLIGVLAAVPGLQLDADQLAAVTGLGDVPQRLDRWLARGLVTASAPAVGADGVRTIFHLRDPPRQDRPRLVTPHRRCPAFGGNLTAG